MSECKTACLINALAGLGNDAVLEDFCGGAGAGVPGLIYPIPFAKTLAATLSSTITIGPLNKAGAVPFALLIDSDTVLAARPTVRIDSIKDGKGDTVGLKGSTSSDISTTWPLEGFYGSTAVERIKAGLPNLPPSIGLIDSTNPLVIAFTNIHATASLGLAGVLFVVIPRTR